MGLVILFLYNYSTTCQESLKILFFTVTNSVLSGDTNKHDTMNQHIVFLVQCILLTIDTEVTVIYVVGVANGWIWPSGLLNTGTVYY